MKMSDLMILGVNKCSLLFFRFFYLYLICLFTGCSFESEKVNNELFDSNYYRINGYAQGSTFSIIYKDSLGRDFSEEINSILINYDLELSTYVDSSLVSNINREYGSAYCTSSSLSSILKENNPKLSYFQDCFLKAKEVYYSTNGAFNPAIFPLVDYWGFFDSSFAQKPRDQNEIDSLLRLISFDDSSFYLTIDTISKGNIVLDISPVICKSNGKSRLDFNGIAQGHSVDVVAKYLHSKHIFNYMVEIGGEVRANGLNPKSELWKIGIDKPIENSTPGSEGFQVIVALKANSLATSGNYRKFYKKEGIKYAHTIDPESGYPVKHSLLSVTVINKEAALADAYATAFMVMGIERSQEFIKSHPKIDLEAYFVYDEEGTNKVWMTEGIQKIIKN